MSKLKDIKAAQALPIGVFDSGLGGLDVAAAISKLLPRERLLYWGDNARVPYGTKSPETVRRYVEEACEQLTRRGVKAIMIACNTASAVVNLAELSLATNVPVFGMIEAGVHACLNAQEPTQILVLATPGTVQSCAYQVALHNRLPHASVVAIPCPLFVPLVEIGWADHPLTPQLVRAQIEEAVEPELSLRLRTVSKDETRVLLGCTHYPLMAQAIARGIELMIGRSIPCIDGAESAALLIKERLIKEELLTSDQRSSTQVHRACFTDDLRGSASLELASYFWSERGGVGELELLSVPSPTRS